jgi:hypothetical protein
VSTVHTATPAGTGVAGAGALCDGGIPTGLTPATCPHWWSSDGIDPPAGQSGQWLHCNVCDADYPGRHHPSNPRMYGNAVTPPAARLLAERASAALRTAA